MERLLDRQDTYKGSPWQPWTQNLYVYCGNNPVNYIDPTGHFLIPVMLVGAGIGALIGGISYAVTAGDDFTWSGLGVSTLGGAAMGAIATIPGIGLGGLMAGGAATGFGTYAGTVVAEHVFEGKELPSALDFIVDSALSAGFGAGGAAAGGTMPGQALRRSLTAAAKNYTLANRANAEVKVVVNVLRSALATYLATEGYQVTEELLDELLSEATEEPVTEPSPQF